MKKIILLGDSTREGYDKYVKEQLNGTAEVFFPNDNCRFALYMLRYLHVWQKEGNWGNDADLVHWSAGLWDALHVLKQDVLTDVDFYAKTIKRIDERLRMLFPKAKIVFATNTPGIDERYALTDSYRLNSEIEIYNKYALEALADTDTVIDDLYAAAKGVPESYYIDAVHMHAPEGRKYIGDKVLNCICPLLGIHKQSDGTWKEAE